MNWIFAALCGAVGGLLVSLIDTGSDILEWRQERRKARSTQRDNPPLANHLDIPADSVTATWRLLIGAIAGGIFAPQLAGVLAAIAVGASAPALLRQLGQARTVQEAITQRPRTNEPILAYDTDRNKEKAKPTADTSDGTETS